VVQKISHRVHPQATPSGVSGGGHRRRRGLRGMLLWSITRPSLPAPWLPRCSSASPLEREPVSRGGVLGRGLVMQGNIPRSRAPAVPASMGFPSTQHPGPGASWLSGATQQPALPPLLAGGWGGMAVLRHISLPACPAAADVLSPRLRSVWTFASVDRTSASTLV